MRRNFGREMLAVASVIVVMTTALTFGVVLSSISGEDVTPVGTNVPTSTVQSNTVPEPTGTDLVVITEEATQVAVVASPSATEVASVTLDDSPTDVPTEEATSTDIPSATLTETETPTPRPSDTATPSATRTPRPSWTPRPTYTATPTATSTDTHTPIPTSTPTETATPTLSGTLAGDLGILETPTPNLSVTPTVCAPPTGWTPITVEPGVTLFMIALAVGEDVPTLQSANCLEDANQIIAGQVVYVPRSPNFGLFRRRETVGCTNPSVQITSPGINGRVSGVFDVMGSASAESFGYYKLEIRADEEAVFHFLMQSLNPVTDGVLGEVDTALFSSGVYWLRLALVDQSGNVPVDSTCIIPMIFE